MGRRKPRSQHEAVECARGLREDVREGLERLAAGNDDAEAVDAVWRGEALGTLLWALQLAELPPYDTPFRTDAVVEVELEGASLRPSEEIALEGESARLWLWRARTAELQAAGATPPPERYASFDQLVAATAMRGYEQGLLPPPRRGDFGAYDKVYRHLSPEQLAEAHSLALERHHALAWLAGHGESWDDVPLDS